MAFFCPIRVRKTKKKKDDDMLEGRAPAPGRITGSASIETLVRVGLEKETGFTSDNKMIVLHDFTPCVDDELEVKRGQIVIMLYQENDWVYVISVLDNSEGFIPYTYCTPLSSALSQIMDHKNKIPRNGVGGGILDGLPTNTGIGGGGGSTVGTALSMLTSSNPRSNVGRITTTAAVHAENQVEMDSKMFMIENHHELENRMFLENVNNFNDNRIQESKCLSRDLIESYSHDPVQGYLPFSKDPSGKYIVLYTFIARDENDVSVERGEHVTVLNKDDPDWFWIIRSDGREGFVPSSFICNPDLLEKKRQQNQNHVSSESNNKSSSHSYPQQQQNQIINGHQHVNHNNNNHLMSQQQFISQQKCSQQQEHSHQNQIPLATRSMNGPSSMFKSANNSKALTTPANIYYNLIPMTSLNTSIKAPPAPSMEESPTNSTLSTLPSGGVASTVSTAASGDSGSRFPGTELIMLYDYKAQAPDELTVMRGDWIYADLTNQSVQGWLWAHDPKLRKYGFIPKAYARKMASID